MGLFDGLFEKKECGVCGKELGLLGKRKQLDGLVALVAVAEQYLRLARAEDLPAAPPERLDGLSVGCGMLRDREVLLAPRSRRRERDVVAGATDARYPYLDLALVADDARDHGVAGNVEVSCRRSAEARGRRVPLEG